MMTDGDTKRHESEELGLSGWHTFLLGVAAVFVIAVIVHLLSHGDQLPRAKVTAAAAVSHILLGERVPTDDKIIAMVRRRSGNKNFGRRDLAWYKTKARQGKLSGQTEPHVIDQRVARYHMIGRFGSGVQI